MRLDKLMRALLADPADNNDLCNLTAEIMTFDGAKFASSSFAKDLNGELKQVDKRFWTTCSTSECFKGCPCSSYSRHVPLWKLARIEQANKFPGKL